MTEVQRGRTDKREHPRRWLLAAALLPIATCATALAGGRVGRSVALSLVGAVAIAAIVVAQRRRGGRTPTTYQVPPAQLLAVAVVAFVAAEALGVGGVAENRGSIGDWTGVAAVIAALVGVWAFLAARVRERALDMVLEGALGALSMAVVFWSVSVEPSLTNGQRQRLDGGRPRRPRRTRARVGHRHASARTAQHRRTLRRAPPCVRRRARLRRRVHRDGRGGHHQVGIRLRDSVDRADDRRAVAHDDRAVASERRGRASVRPHRAGAHGCRPLGDRRRGRAARSRSHVVEARRRRSRRPRIRGDLLGALVARRGGLPRGPAARVGEDRAPLAARRAHRPSQPAPVPRPAGRRARRERAQRRARGRDVPRPRPLQARQRHARPRRRQRVAHDRRQAPRRQRAAAR